MLSLVLARGRVAGPGALNPLALQVVGDHGTIEPAGSGIAYGDARPMDRRVVRQKADPLVIALAASTSLDARAHERTAPGVEGREHGDRVQRGGREHVAIVIEYADAQA